MNLLLKLSILIIIIILSGCAPFQQKQEKLKTIAELEGFNFERVLTGQFLLSTFKKINPNDRELVVYIEGDGYAWKRKNILSDNPTPKNPVALNLALKDPRDSILYIARPCQYLSKEQLENCQPKYWSSHRYAEEVISSINNVIERVKLQSGKQFINLIGYSGGGSVAALVATLRNDVSSIITVVANLDHEKWTEIHNITPLSGSLNASDYALKNENIPQIHLVGANDDIVPVSISKSYKQKAGNKKFIKIEIISNYNHHCCWEQQWITLLCKYQIIESGYCS